MKYAVIVLLLALVLIIPGCTTTKAPVTPAETTVTIAPTPTAAPMVTAPQAGVDPIIGTWDNGMVFNADHTVGDSRNVTWKANDMEQYSYFVTVESPAVKDKEGLTRIDPSAQSREWIYNPYSDTIHIRDQGNASRRALPGSVP